MHDPDLIIPVYLNQRFVFDLVAMLQDGIATVTKVVKTEAESSSAAAEVGGTFGLNKALSALFRVDLSGSVSGETGGESSASRREERIHTPASLFYKVRQLLVQKNALEKDSEKYAPQPGDFVEFHSSLKRNPIIETMEGLHEIMKAASAFSTPTPKPSQRGKRTALDKDAVIREQIKTFTEMLKAGGTLDLITPPLQSSHRCVVTLESQYLNDPSLSDLVEGTLRVVGKVIRVVGEGEGSVSLVRKTPLGQMPKEFLEKVFSHLEALLETGFRFPPLTREIDGPVIQLLPVAIFA